jgi:hypothetical protein
MVGTQATSVFVAASAKHALLAKNVEYSAGSVGTRHGYAPITALPSIDSVFEVYNWIAPFSQINSAYADSAVVMINNGLSTRKYRVYNLNTSVSSGLLLDFPYLPATTAAASVIGVGMHLYSTLVDNKQRGFSAPGLQVYTIFNNGGFVGSYANTLFTAPVTFAPAASEPGAGVVTAGVHRLGYLIEYANGFTTRVSPDTSVGVSPSISTFAPVSITSSGSKSIRLTFTPGWTFTDLHMVSVSAVMTTTADLNQYYIVPGSRTTVSPTGVAPAFNIDISISDADLSSQGIDATPYLYWLTNSTDNHPPFVTRHIALFGNRMAYLDTSTDSVGTLIDALYVSEQNNYQAITADQHIIQLPGQRPIATMFRMGSLNYILGPHEIWAVTDNNDVPASWAAAQLIDGRHGTQAIHGVEVAPSGNYAWIADQGGLYLFTGGPITSLPVSYYQTPDWNRINWGAAYCVKIRDDASNKRVHVMVPLDGASTPSHIMTWDYTNGITPDAVMYSLDNVSGYALGAMELVRNDLSGQATGNAGKVELWLGTSGTDYLLRKQTDADTHPYRDNGGAINGLYRSCPLPGRSVSQGQIMMHHGFHARLTGSGTITPTIYDIDAANSFPCSTFTLSTSPNQDTLVLARIRNELAYVEFSTNTLDVYWRASYLKWYYSPYLMQR